MSTTNITSGTDFIGKTLIIGSTALAMRDWGRVFDFNNNSTDTYVFSTGGGSGHSLHWFEYRHASGNNNVWDSISSSLNVYYIYVLSFVSNIQLKFNIYRYNSPSTIINDTFLTISIPNTFLSSLTHFWLGRSAYDWDAFYNGIYNKVALYNGDLLALTEANVLSTLLTVVTSTQTNIINNNTYIFRSLGTNFLGVVVNMFNNNTTQGYTVSGSSIILNGTNSTTGGYLNIIGSYLETAPNIPTNTPTNTPTNVLGSIYATTISSEKYIVITSQNIELSGNVIMKANHAISISNGIFNTNSIVPNVPNSASLGSTSTSWSNAYFRDLSVNNNLQVTGNVKIGGVLDCSNIYTKSQFDNSFANVYTRGEIDLSFQNIYTRGYIDQSYANIYTGGQIDQSFQNVYTRAQVDLSFENVYTREYIDTSFANLYTRAQFDTSYANVYTIKQFDSSFANVYTIGEFDNSYANVYTIQQFDQSFANVYTRSRVDTSFQNVHTKLQFDTSFQNVYTIQQFDQSFANVYTRGLIDTSFQNVHTIAQFDQSYANVYTRGYIDTSFSIANVYTKRAFDLSYANVYIKSRIDNSFQNVHTIREVDNSYANIYIKSHIDNSFANVHTRTQFDLSYVFKRAVELSFNALPAPSAGGGSTVVLTSISSDIIPALNNTYNLGSTTRYWNNSYINNLKVSNRAYQEISGDISWSAVNGYYGLAKDAYPSLNPRSSGVKAVTNMTTRTRFSWGIGSCCWSPQLLRFVGAGYLSATWSNDGINWTQNNIANQDSRLNTNWTSICWSPELMLFVAVADSGRVMRSSNGISWTFTIAFSNANWASVCWSPQLMLFVATGRDAGTNNVITSPDGITWTRQINIPECNWNNVCWSAELGIFLAASDGGTHVFMISKNGINWTGLGVPTNAVGLRGICWSKELGLFVGVIGNTSIISNNGLTWTSYSMNWSGYAWSICWIPELKLFVVINDNDGANRLIMNTSTNGINWNPVTYSGDFKTYRNITWSPEFGIFVCISIGGGNGAIHTALVSSLKGRPPTSYNVFDSSFNSIDETGKWTFLNVAISGTMTAGSTNVTSDDRLKHNEVGITNGLTIIDQLTPKFYQKTFTMLDASYSGDLSGYAWIYEAGLIAQEVLQVPDLSFAVSGGDYYQESYILRDQTNDISSNYDISSNSYDISSNSYDISSNYYDISSNYYDISSNYDISTNLIKQPYALNYNSIFSYGVAAIKELHAKVKAQTTNSLDQQLNSLIERIETLEA